MADGRSMSREDSTSNKANSTAKENENVARDHKYQLIHLRTKGEVEASNATVDVYVVEIPTKSTSAIIDLLKEVIQSKELQSLQHLRRIVKPEFLPLHLRPQNSAPSSEVSEDGYMTLSTVYLIIGPVNSTDHGQLTPLFAKNEDLFAGLKLEIQAIPVPALAPTSAAQATLWTEKYWPTVFRNTNPYGPHPAMVRRAELELLADTGPEIWMSLAWQVARESIKLGVGVEVGAVVLDRNGKDKKTAVVAVAGDARFGSPSPNNDTCCGGNVMGHAVMRAIGMVAKKRVFLAENRLKDWPAGEEDGQHSPLLDSPLTLTEEEYFKRDTLEENGYLCLDLKIYITHEPCVMCSMALLHSRFGRVIFEQRMPETGALTAEGDNDRPYGSLGYGLFWRPVKLNWRLLCWQYARDGQEPGPAALDKKIHA